MFNCIPGYVFLIGNPHFLQSLYDSAKLSTTQFTPILGPASCVHGVRVLPPYQRGGEHSVQASRPHHSAGPNHCRSARVGSSAVIQGRSEYSCVFLGDMPTSSRKMVLMDTGLAQHLTNGMRFCGSTRAKDAPTQQKASEIEE